MTCGGFATLRERPWATVLVDRYEDDWEQLWWVRIRGAARVHDAADPFADTALAALAAKYQQYAQRRPLGPVYSVDLDEVRWWRPASPDD